MRKNFVSYVLSLSVLFVLLLQQQGQAIPFWMQRAIGPATQLVFSGEPTITQAGNAITPAVKVAIEDANGNIVTSRTDRITVKWSLGGVILQANAVNGVATFDSIMLSTVGTNTTLIATAPGLSSATSSPFSVTPGPPNYMAFSAQPTTTQAGTAIAPSVQVTIYDEFNNIATQATGAVTIALGANPGPSTLGGTLTATPVNGVATFSTLSLKKVAAGYTLVAAYGTLTAVTSSPFDIIPGLPTVPEFTVEPTNTAAGSAITPAIQVTLFDAYNNICTQATNPVTIALVANPGNSTLGGTLTAPPVNGVASFNNLTLNKVGTRYTLSATYGTFTGTSNTFNITFAPPKQVVFTVQPPTNTAAGSSITPAIQVSIEDAFGNIVTTATNIVTIALGANPGPSTLGGTLTATPVNGVATFSTLSLNKVDTGYTLAASSGTLTGATSNTFNITPGPPAKLTFTVQPTNTQTGATISPAVQVTVYDASGNIATQTTSSITLALNTVTGGTGATLNGTASQTPINGVAMFSSLSIAASGTYTLTASMSGVSGVPSAPFTVSTSSKLVFTTQPATVLLGATLTPVVVSLEDQSGHLVTATPTSISLAITSGTGTKGALLGGTTPVTTVNGKATFNDLTINLCGSGYTFTATAPGGVASAISSPFTVTDTPTITPQPSPMPTQNIAMNKYTPQLPFIIGDLIYPTTQLTVTGTSTNTTVVPNNDANIQITGTLTTTKRTVAINPAPGQSGTTTITVTVTNPDGQHASFSFVVNVFAPPLINGVNTNIPPLPAQTIVTSTTKTATVTFNVSDLENLIPAGTLAVTAASSTNSALVPTANIKGTNSNGLVTATITPAAGQGGTTTITFSVTNPTIPSLVSQITFPLTVYAIAPVINPKPMPAVGILYNTPTKPQTFTASDNVTPANQLQVSQTSSNTTLVPTANIVVTGPVVTGSVGTWSVTVTPATGQTGVATITLTVTDLGGLSSSTPLTVSVFSPPTITPNPITNQVTNINKSVTVSFTAGDAVTPPAQLKVSATSSNATLVPNSNSNIATTNTNGKCTVVLTPASTITAGGVTTITITVTDGGNVSTTTSFLLSVYAQPPTFKPNPIADQTTYENTATAAVPFTVSDPLTTAASLVVTPVSSSVASLVPLSGIVITGPNATGACTVTVTPVALKTGSTLITLKVTDLGGLSTTMSFTVTVTGPPTFTPNFNALTVNYNVSDAQAGAITVTASSSNLTLVPLANIVCAGTGATRTVTATTLPGVSGTATITVTATNAGGLAKSFTFVITGVTATIF